MASANQRPKLVVIVGPTASGKSDLAIELAKMLNGEIICADSRTIYKNMNIGTAKPTSKNREEVCHYGLDLIDPGQSYSAENFQKYARQKIIEINNKNKLPILVGGTGLYIDGVIFNFEFSKKADSKLRQKLESMSIEELIKIIIKRKIKMPKNHLNRRHLIRTIEIGGQNTSKSQMPDEDVLIIGINPPDDVLKARIKKRAEANLEGIIEETKHLLKQYHESEFIKTAGIPYISAVKFLQGSITKDEVLEKIKTSEWQYARRQRTWFKRNPYILWFDSADKALKAVESM